MELVARFPYANLNHTVDTDTHLVLSLTAPTLDWVANRPKLCILPVIDLSGSMRGKKLDYAKKSILKLIEHLSPGDIFGLYGFESRVHPLVEPGPVTPAFKETLKAAVGKLTVMGGTNLSEGLLKAIQTVKLLDLPVSFVQRIIVFTDGQPTEGVTDNAAILKMMSANLGNVTLSAFGYGDTGGAIYSGCDQDFLTELSRQGKGNYAYVPDPDAALAAFGKELGGLLSSYATDLKLTVERSNGHLITSVVTDVNSEEDVTGAVTITLPDIMSQETRHLVLGVKLEKQAQAFPRQTTAFKVAMSYSVITSEGKKEVRQATASARVQFVKPGEEQKEPDKELDAIIGLAQMVRTQMEAEERARKGDYAMAAAMMVETAGNLAARGHTQLGTVSHNLAARLGSSQGYQSGRGYLRSVQGAGTRAYAVSGMDDQAYSDLIGARVELSNQAMEYHAMAFAETPPSVELSPVPDVTPQSVTWQTSLGRVVPTETLVYLGDQTVGVDASNPLASLRSK